MYIQIKNHFICIAFLGIVAQFATIFTHAGILDISSKKVINTQKKTNKANGKERFQQKKQEKTAENFHPITTEIDNGGFRAKSADGNFILDLGGRVQIDFTSLSGVQNLDTTRGDLRRLRLNVTGTLYKVWDYRFEADFGGNDFTNDFGINNPVLTYGFFKFTGFQPVNLIFGYQKVPVSMESMVGSNWTTFQDRSLANSLINNEAIGRRRLGLVLEASGEQGTHWTAQTGFYGAGFSNIGQSTENWGTSGRVTFAPIAEPGQVIHIGSSTYYRNFTKSPSLDFSVSPESHLSPNFIGTNLLLGAQNTLLLQGELSTVWGAFHAQSEYFYTQIERKRSLSQLNFNGWYAQAGYFLTGESRNYIPRKGIYGQTNLNHPMDQDGWGAWEIAARYSAINLNSRGVHGGEENNFTFGINWWTTHNTLLRANYVHAIANSYNLSGRSNKKFNADIFMMRAQLNF
ncbi:OprO/OprP family phosphate-selective porin [Candidatus Nitrosacidococcus sp. I8]|uniref:OprO/OprP family phosphate-selective porin n=1 Tax=Candidatus Nitrosacidococcus sp. I8 TaxID=2942908 RepID=UPI002225F27C|nr:porin [Candidatus Nitrosacidococcus sp. I8]CAH9017093.1 Porin P [Candidatus Nitrosacidococcus sp. I8]